MKKSTAEKSNPRIELEQRVQRVQRAIADLEEAVPQDLLTEETICKITGFLGMQVSDLLDGLRARRVTGARRGVFSLDAPFYAPKAKMPVYDEPTAPEPPPKPTPRPAPPEPEPDEPKLPKKLFKAEEIVGREAPKEVAKEILKTAEDAPEKVRVFGSGKPPPPPVSDDVDFAED